MWLLNSSVVADPVVSNQRCFGKLSQTYIVHKTDKHNVSRGLGLSCLMPLSTIFQLYRGS